MSAEQSARDNRTYTVSARTLASVERQMTEITRRLQAPNGSPIDPDSVKNALQCVREGRDVLPGHGDVKTLYPHHCVPVPMHIWVKSAWANIDELGVKWQTSLALREMQVRYIGTLLLYTEEELSVKCNGRAMRDLRHCLRKSALRLPTANELDAAKAAGFWVELPNRFGINNLRVAAELAPLEAILYLHGLRGTRDGFFPWAQMVTLGDLLKKTEAEVLTLWQEYVIDCHVGGNAERKAVLSDGMRELLLTEASMLADEVVNWVAAAGLKFAA